MNIRPLHHVAVAASLLGLSNVLMADNDGYNSRSQDASQAQQQRSQQQSNTSMQQGYNGRQTSSTDPRGRTLDAFKGCDVIGQDGEKLGDIDHFVIDTQSGRIAYALVGSGGVLGIGEKLHPVPFEAFKPEMNSTERVTLSNIDKAKWESSPTFKRSELSSLSQRGQEIAQFYGVQLQQAAQDVSQGVKQAARKVTGQPTSSGTQQFVLASDIVGRDIHSSGAMASTGSTRSTSATGNATSTTGTGRDQTVGTIEDIIVQNSSSGKAALIVDLNEDFAGVDQKVIVPFNRVNGYSPNSRDVLTTTMSRDDISSAKAVTDDSWAADTSRNSLYVWAANAWDNTKAATHRAADKVSRETRDSANSAQNRVSSTGQAPVEAIKRAVQQSGGQNVQVTTSGNKVILSGTVSSEDIKDKIEDRAEEAAKGWNIDNQIRVSSADE